jgi:nicotinamidase-related amidase
MTRFHFFWITLVLLVLVPNTVACAPTTPPPPVRETVPVPQTVVAPQTVVVPQTVAVPQTVVVPQTVIVPPTPAPTSASAAVAAILTITATVPVEVDAKTTALLVLDITSTICQPRKSCVATLPAIAALLKKARDAKSPVVYSDTGGNSTILPEVAQLPDEPKVTGRADKFINTNLDDILKARGIKTVVIVGYVANGAVLYTTFGANIRGYTAVVPTDGTGAEDPFAYTMTLYQLLNQPGFGNVANKPLSAGQVTLSKSDLITFK